MPQSNDSIPQTDLLLCHPNFISEWAYHREENVDRGQKVTFASRELTTIWNSDNT